jgi:hypothetical protein
MGRFVLVEGRAMSLRMISVVHAITFSCAITAGAVLLSAGAEAQSVQKQCGDQWKAAKAAGSVPADQKWADYLKECRARMAQGAGAGAAAAPAVTTSPIGQPAPTNPLKPSGAPAATTTVPTAAPETAGTAAAGQKPKKPMSPGMAAFHEREKKCGEEWRGNTAQIKAQTPGITWPKYLSACNKRLKAGQ